jgi:hypothetical protein
MKNPGHLTREWDMGVSMKENGVDLNCETLCILNFLTRAHRFELHRLELLIFPLLLL